MTTKPDQAVAGSNARPWKLPCGALSCFVFTAVIAIHSMGPFLVLIVLSLAVSYWFSAESMAPKTRRAVRNTLVASVILILVLALIYVISYYIWSTQVF